MKALIAFLLMTVPALAVERPPAQYRHEPSVDYQLHLVSFARVQRECKGQIAMGNLKRQAQGLKPTLVAEGCVNTVTNDVWVRNDTTYTDKLIEHEKGHLNGWRH